MSRSGPFFTLAAGAVLAAGLAAASVTAAPALRQVDAQATAPPVEVTTTPGQTASPQQTDSTQTDSTQTDSTQTDSTQTEPAQTEPAAVDTTPKKADYAGVAQGNGGLVAIAVRDGRAVAYFCDGRIESWLKGTAADDTVVLKGRHSLITAALGKGRAQGKIQFGDATWRFVAPLVRKPSGLYRATAVVRGARIVGGWIVLPSGQEVGRVGIGGSGEPAPAFTPGSPVDYYGVPLRPQEPDAFLDDLAP
ncbi:hypothetical protein GCM10009530_30510 [Microbispora corallina]|uniref:Serine/threonine protein kinase n=1 Tax=Microbispora corallina TaxID=83302 RepID=A0ABQ4G0M9_9ACTN|nr:hypothetical protein [Microbispora corallina]GIH40619.1 hypothetical protein Mco01_36190 [Microbispora corallina]